MRHTIATDLGKRGGAGARRHRRGDHAEEDLGMTWHMRGWSLHHSRGTVVWRGDRAEEEDLLVQQLRFGCEETRS